MDIADFARLNFDHYRQPRYWWVKAVSLRQSAVTLYEAARPQLARYVAAMDVAYKMMEDVGREQAEILAEAPNIMPIYLLHGYAIENALKCVLIHQNPQILQSARLPWTGNGHELHQLATSAGISLANREEAILRWLSEVVTWKGRYSTPNTIEKFKTFWAFDHLQDDFVDDCLSAIDLVFGNAKNALPQNITSRSSGFGVIVRVDDDPP